MNKYSMTIEMFWQTATCNTIHKMHFSSLDEESLKFELRIYSDNDDLVEAWEKCNTSNFKKIITEDDETTKFKMIVEIIKHED